METFQIPPWFKQPEDFDWWLEEKIQEFFEEGSEFEGPDFNLQPGDVIVGRMSIWPRRLYSIFGKEHYSLMRFIYQISSGDGLDSLEQDDLFELSQNILYVQKLGELVRMLSVVEKRVDPNDVSNVAFRKNFLIVISASEDIQTSGITEKPDLLDGRFITPN